MTRKLKTLPILLLTIFAFALSSCNDDNHKSLPDGTMFDIVTLVENNDKGSVFEFRKDGDSPLITLTSERKLDEKEVKVGQRIMIAYVPLSGVSYVSGSIDLIAYRSVFNGNIVIGKASDWNNFGTYEQRVTFINRSGNYINVSAEIYVQNEPKVYNLVLDEKTLDKEYPQAYIIYRPDSDLNGTMKTGYASWDISSVWALGTCKGLKISWVDENSNIQTRTFDKDQQQVKPAE